MTGSRRASGSCGWGAPVFSWVWLLFFLFLSLRLFLADRGRAGCLVLLFPFHPAVLEPDFDLSLSQTQSMSDLYAPPSRQVAIVVEFFLQLQSLVPGVRLAAPLSVGACAPHPGVDSEVALIVQVRVSLLALCAVLLGGVTRAHQGKVLLKRRTVHIKGSCLQPVAGGRVHSRGLGVQAAPIAVYPGHGSRVGRPAPRAIARALRVGSKGARSLLREDSGWEDRSCSWIFGE